MSNLKIKRTIIIICIALLLIAAIFLFNGTLLKNEPPGLKVSNGSSEISASQGTYTWQTGISSWVNSDSMGPLELYNLGRLEQIKPAEDSSFSLKFDNRPGSVSVVIYPESSAAAEDYGSAMLRNVSGSSFTVPTDGVYIINVLAKWSRGECYYYFCSTP